MKKFTNVVIATATIVMVLGLVVPTTALAIAATAPNLGTASTFSVLGGGLLSSAATTTISGDLGATTKTGTWTHTGGSDYIAGAAAGALSDAVGAWTTMGATGGTAWDPVTDINPAPGLWTRSGDATFSNTLTLDGSATDVWIFQINDSLTFTGTVVLSGGAQACNVYWRVASSATINGNTGNTFVGTLIANSSVSVVTAAGSSTIDGRLVANTGTLSTAGTTNISGPSCVVATPTPTPTATPASGAGVSRHDSTINVVKAVINDNTGTKTVTDFPLFLNGKSVISGATTNFPVPVGIYTVTETGGSGYTRTFSGDCDTNGQMNLNSGDNKYCIITNNDIGAPVVPPVPPLIDVLKVPSPLALPAGPGPVTYTYTLRNIGTVPMTNITMVGDTCGPIVRVSGDTNGDSILQTSETWVHTCTTTLAETHTNTVVATGWANGISAVDVASATVVVGEPIVPPLIHVTKIPNPLALNAAGGAVTYTYTVTNPGTAPLSNVSITDDKCTGLPGRVLGHPGDLNHNDLLESNESWSFTCRSNLTATTTNTATASGTANGLTVRDIAVATVVVAIPRLPSTGLPPQENSGLWTIIFASAIVLVLVACLAILRKRTA